MLRFVLMYENKRNISLTIFAVKEEMPYPLVIMVLPLKPLVII
jgi:hypothetical protein